MSTRLSVGDGDLNAGPDVLVESALSNESPPQIHRFVFFFNYPKKMPAIEIGPNVHQKLLWFRILTSGAIWCYSGSGVSPMPTWKGLVPQSMAPLGCVDILGRWY